VPARCPIDDLPDLNRMIATGVATHTSFSELERRARQLGRPTKRETMKRHLVECPPFREPAPFETDPEIAKAVAAGDFATAVQRQALAEIAQGRARVSVKDGLAAQALIDRREEKSEERKFFATIARLMSGGGAAAPEQLIEGEFREIDPAQALLAPPEMRE
jgi:hypothetical protein